MIFFLILDEKRVYHPNDFISFFFFIQIGKTDTDMKDLVRNQDHIIVVKEEMFMSG